MLKASLAASLFGISCTESHVNRSFLRRLPYFHEKYHVIAAPMNSPTTHTNQSICSIR